MGRRPYRRATMSLSAPLAGAVTCGALAALVWAIVVGGAIVVVAGVLLLMGYLSLLCGGGACE